MPEIDVFVQADRATLTTTPGVSDMLAGRTMEEAGRDKFDGDLLGASCGRR